MGHTRNADTGKLTFDNTPSTTADFNALSDRAEEIAAGSVPTLADLQALPYPNLGETRLVEATGELYMLGGSGWVRIWNDEAWVNMGYPNNTKTPGFGNPISYILEPGRTTLAGATQKISTTWKVGDVLFTLPADARPANAAYFTAAGSGSSLATLQVLSNGEVSVKGIISGDPVWLSVDGWTIRTTA